MSTIWDHLLPQSCSTMICHPAFIQMGLFHLVISQSSDGDDDENTDPQPIDVTGNDDYAAGVHFESVEQGTSNYESFNSTANILIMHMMNHVLPSCTCLVMLLDASLQSLNIAAFFNLAGYNYI